MPFLDTVKESTDKGDVEGELLKENIEMVEKEAYESGFQAGEKAGFAVGEEKARVLIEKLETVLREITSLRERLIRELEPQVLELAVSIAKRILTEELKIAPEHIVQMTKEALKKIERTGQIKIKINPSLYELFMNHRPEILDIHPDVVFDVDHSVSECGSLVIGTLEDVVTDIDEQLRNLIKEMAERNGDN